jgi:hypothetical protein
VLESAEAVAAAFHLLDAQVEAFGRTVGSAGGVVSEDLGSPRGEGAAEGADLFDVVFGASNDGFVDEQRRLLGIVGEVDVAHGFLGQPGADDFVVRVTDTQSEQHPVVAALVETFATGQEQLADPIQRIGLAAPMLQRLVLDAAADLVDAAVGDAHHMKRVSHPGGVSEVRIEAGPVRLGQIGGHHPDTGQPPRVLWRTIAAGQGRRCLRPCR